MRLDHCLLRLIQLLKIGFDERNRARWLTVRICIDQDRRFVSILQRIREIEASNAEIDDSHLGREARRWTSRFTTSTPNPSSPRKMFPIPATRMRGRRLAASGARRCFVRQWFDFLRDKEKAMAGLAQHTHIPPGIVLQHHADVDLAFVVLLDALDERDLPGQRDVEDVAAVAADAAARDLPPSLPLRRWPARSTVVLSSSNCHSHSFMACPP